LDASCETMRSTVDRLETRGISETRAQRCR
jgi:hypothetical protein